MKKLLVVFVVALTFLLSGCSSNEYYEDELETYSSVAIISNEKSNYFETELVDSMSVNKNGVLEIVYRENYLYIYNSDYVIIFQ